jgi:hypothetical protein
MWHDSRRDAWEIESCPDCGTDVVIKRRPHQGKCPTCAAATRRNLKAIRQARRAELEAQRLASIRPDHWVEYVESNGNPCRGLFDTKAEAEAFADAILKRGARSAWVERYVGPNRSVE